ncbi:MAG: hypothetical protein WEA56_16855 [Balneolaceae bacterium]
MQIRTRYIVLWAFVLHTIWEFTQCVFLFDMWDWPFWETTLWMWGAVFGDILIVLALWKGTTTLVTSARFESPGLRGYLVLLTLSFAASIFLEWAALYLNLWQYTTAMPVVSIFGHEVGLSPVLQITFLPAASIWLANLFNNQQHQS